MRREKAKNLLDAIAETICVKRKNADGSIAVNGFSQPIASLFEINFKT